MAQIIASQIVNDVIKEYPKTITVFTNFNIDSCCGGATSIEVAANRDKAPLEALMEALNKAATS
ncbi:MAG: DUF542 domain-containing protein [Deltaproteobacteria bacterium]|nr:DUF542 domain-containing protein [Deltaproteobacteria bacterium]